MRIIKNLIAKQHVRKHIAYYLIFGIVQLLGLFLVLSFEGNRQLQFAAILGTTIFYFIFAVSHHLLDHDLTSKIVVEYALMGCVGLAVSLILFNT